MYIENLAIVLMIDGFYSSSYHDPITGYCLLVAYPHFASGQLFQTEPMGGARRRLDRASIWCFQFTYKPWRCLEVICVKIVR